MDTVIEFRVVITKSEVNDGNPTDSDIRDLAEQIKDEVMDNYPTNEVTYEIKQA